MGENHASAAKFFSLVLYSQLLEKDNRWISGIQLCR
jgi:hypothetical protein